MNTSPKPCRYSLKIKQERGVKILDIGNKTLKEYLKMSGIDNERCLQKIFNKLLELNEGELTPIETAAVAAAAAAVFLAIKKFD